MKLKKNQFNQTPKKIRKKNNNQIEKNIYIANWDGRMKLKTIKTSIRGSRKKKSKSKE